MAGFPHGHPRVPGLEGGTEAELALCLKNIHPSSCSSVLILFFPNQFLKVKMTDRFLLWAVVLLIK